MKRRRGVNSSTGFTLLELLVVLAILGLIGGIAFPAVGRAIEAQAFSGAARRVELSVRQAQADAVRYGRMTVLPRLTIDDAGLSPNQMRARAAGDLRIVQPADLRFFRDGTASGGVIEIRSSARRFQVTVDPMTGVITAGYQ